MTNSTEALHILEKAGLKLGVNWQKELSELISDISAKDNISCLELVESPLIQTILNDKNLSSLHKRARIKEELQRRRYPLYYQAKAEFNRLLKDLKINPKIKVTPTPFFEKNKLSFEFQSDNERELKQVQADIKKIKEADLVKKALDCVEQNI